MFESSEEQLLMEEVAYGNTNLVFTVTRKNRKLLAIEVHPDLSIKVIAPIDAELDDIKKRVLKKGNWIIKQFSYFEQFLPRTPEREYVSGETHLYLGRRYLLKLRTSKNRAVKLVGGELIVFLEETSNKEMIKRLLGNWYYAHAKKKFSHSIKVTLDKFKNYKIDQEPPLVIKRMAKRWGSCTPSGQIILNPEIIKTPSRCVEYVIIHELCHLIHPNHSKEFYDLQTEIMPDWEKWKLRLEKTLI